MPTDPLSQISLLYHFTDRRNAAQIRKLGGLWSRRELTRKGKTFHAGGNEWSFDADEMFDMDKYVHLCFRSSHPMEYIANREGRIEQTLWVCISPQVLQLEGVMYSHGVSNQSGMEIVPIRDAVDLIDFEVICTKTDWKDPQIKARLDHAEKCEVLVPKHIPMNYIYESYLPNG